MKRVVSLLPSCTEMVFALGCGGQLVGRSHVCDFPPEAAALPACTAPLLDVTGDSAAIHAQVEAARAGGHPLYALDTAKIRELRPDVILTQSQCPVCAVSLEEVERVAQSLPPPRPEVAAVSATRLAGIWSDIQTVANAIGASEPGRELLATLKNRVVDVIEKACQVKKRPSVACLEWLDPLMIAGHWTPELVELAGGRDPLGLPGQRSTVVSWETLAAADPDFLILMPCGFDLARTRQAAAALARRPGWKTLRSVKSNHVVAVNGSDYFNRPGPRLVDSLELLAEILQPKRFSYGHARRASDVVR